jgi:hypothetical protein
LGADGFFLRDESGNAGGSQFLAKNLLCLADAAQIELAPTPEHLDFSLAEGIRLLLQHDMVGSVRRLLNQGADSKFTEAAFEPTQSRPATTTL